MEFGNRKDRTDLERVQPSLDWLQFEVDFKECATSCHIHWVTGSWLQIVGKRSYVSDKCSLTPRLWPDLQCMNAIIAASGSWPLALHLVRPRDSTSPAASKQNTSTIERLRYCVETHFEDFVRCGHATGTQASSIWTCIEPRTVPSWVYALGQWLGAGPWNVSFNATL